MLQNCAFREYDVRCRSYIYANTGVEVLDYAIGYVADEIVFTLLMREGEGETAFYERVQAKMFAALDKELQRLFSVLGLRDHQVRYPSGKIYLFDNGALVARTKRLIDFEFERNPNLFRKLLSDAYMGADTEVQLRAALKLAVAYAPLPGTGFANDYCAARYAFFKARSENLAHKMGYT